MNAGVRQVPAKIRATQRARNHSRLGGRRHDTWSLFNLGLSVSGPSPFYVVGTGSGFEEPAVVTTEGRA